MSMPAECSLAEFAKIARVNRSYVTELKKAGRLVLTDTGKVRVTESLALIEATRSPAHQGVADRHTAARETGAGGVLANAPTPPLVEQAGQLEDAEEPDLPTSPHSDRRARALADKEEAAARKALRDEQLELGQLLRASEVGTALADAAVTLRGAFENMPHELAPELAALNDEAMVCSRLMEFVETQFTELARRFAAIARRERSE